MGKHLNQLPDGQSSRSLIGTDRDYSWTKLESSSSVDWASSLAHENCRLLTQMILTILYTKTLEQHTHLRSASPGQWSQSP